MIYRALVKKPLNDSQRRLLGALVEAFPESVDTDALEERGVHTPSIGGVLGGISLRFRYLPDWEEKWEKRFPGMQRSRHAIIHESRVGGVSRYRATADLVQAWRRLNGQ
jgi:hypothetical protein